MLSFLVQEQAVFCAVTAARRNFYCIIVDHSPIAGRKVKLSGGGKGNVTNLYMSTEWYVGQNTVFTRQALQRCMPNLILNLLKEYNIPWEERSHGQIFCTVPASHLVIGLSGMRFKRVCPVLRT